jgi:hypothetical protein
MPPACMDSTDICGRQGGERNISIAHYTVQNNRGGGRNIRNVFQQGNNFPEEVKQEDQDLNDMDTTENKNDDDRAVGV